MKVKEHYLPKFKIGDVVKFDNENARIRNVYITRGGKTMYTVGSSKHGDIEAEAEDIDIENK